MVGFSPVAFAMILSASLWKVTQVRSFSPSLSERDSAAFRVKVMSRILEGSTPCLSMRYLTFPTEVIVFPLPALAITSTLSSRDTMDSRCWSLRGYFITCSKKSEFVLSSLSMK